LTNSTKESYHYIMFTSHSLHISQSNAKQEYQLTVCKKNHTVVS